MRIPGVGRWLWFAMGLLGSRLAAGQAPPQAAAQAPAEAPAAPAAAGSSSDEEEQPAPLGVATERARALLSERLAESDSYKVRAQAAILLGRVGDARTVPVLLRALEQDEHFAVRAAAATALGALAEDAAAEPLFAGAADPEPLVRDACARAITRLDAHRNFDLLLRYARTGAEDQRRAAVSRLGDVARTGDATAVESVVRALGDRTKEVRQAAATAISDLPSDRAIPILTAALRNDDAGIRAEAARLLGPRRDPRAVDSLAEAYDRVGEQERVRAEIRRSLERLSPMVNQQELARAARKDPDREVRARSIRLLGVVGDPRAATDLEDLLGDPDEFIAGTAALALADMGSIQSISRLEEASRAHAGSRAQAPMDAAVRRLQRLREQR